MPRPVWSGTISFGLVTIPVKLFHAVSRKNVSFNQLDDRSMSRIRMKKVSAETGEDVPDEHIVKGYEVAKGRYVVVDPDELEPFIPAATKAIDLEEFVDLAEIDPVFFDTPYIVAPDNAAKPYMLLTKAMEDSGKVAVGTFVMRSKQYVAALRPVDGRLMLSTMAFADEVVDPATIDELGALEDVTLNAKELAMAEQLVESLAGDFEPDRFNDTYREQVLDLIAKKAAGEAFEAPEPAAAATAGHRPHGRARGQRQGGQGRPRAPSRHRQAGLGQGGEGDRERPPRRGRDRGGRRGRGRGAAGPQEAGPHPGPQVGLADPSSVGRRAQAARHRRRPGALAQQPRQGPLPGDGHDEGPGHRVLRPHRAGDAAPPGRPGADLQPLPQRRRAEGLLREALRPAPARRGCRPRPGPATTTASSSTA